MRKLIVLLLSCLLLSFFSQSYAVTSISFKKPPILNQASESSLKVSWDKQTWALGYYIYYGKKPYDGKPYESSVPDFIDGTGGTIIGLDALTKYYVAIVAVDENGEESVYSPEAVFDTLKPWSSPKLAVKEVKVVTSNAISLGFNVPLDTSTTAQREFKIVDQINSGEKEVKKSEVQNTNFVIVTLSNDMLPNTKYEVTVLSLQDKNGKSIESGVDGIISFITPPVFPSLTPTAQPKVEQPKDTIPELKSGGPEAPVVQKNTESGMKWQNVQLENIKKTVVSNVAKESTKLPQTGPEHIILIIISLLVGAIVFSYTKRYQARF